LLASLVSGYRVSPGELDHHVIGEELPHPLEISFVESPQVLSRDRFVRMDLSLLPIVGDTICKRARREPTFRGPLPIRTADHLRGRIRGHSWTYSSVDVVE
jgi:hypothetical protein